MAINDNWHMCPGTACGCGFNPRPAYSVSPYSAYPFPASPPAFPPPVPHCPATHRHVRRFGAEVTGVQCKYEPGHEGDHCAFTFGDGDVFWPQEAPAMTEGPT